MIVKYLVHFTSMASTGDTLVLIAIGRNSCVEMNRASTNSIDIFSYSGPSGILGSDGKQNSAGA